MTTISTAARNAAADNIVALLDGGNVRIYPGTRPGTPNDATGETALVELDLANPAFGSAVDGVATAETIPSKAAAETGTATWFRGVDSGGNGVIDGSVGTSGAEMNLNTVEFTQGVDVEITSWTVTMPSGA